MRPIERAVLNIARLLNEEQQMNTDKYGLPSPDDLTEAQKKDIGQVE